MKLTSEEIMGLNSLLDGKKIWGFHESIKAELDIAEKKRIAEKLLKYGEKGINELLYFLNAYKNAGDYVVINELNIALTDGRMLALMKLEEEYQFFIVEKEQIKEYISGKDHVILFCYKNNEIYGFDTLQTGNGMRNQSLQQTEEIDELVERYLG